METVNLNVRYSNAHRYVVRTQHDYILLDRSGSMSTRWNDTLGGVNAYVHALAASIRSASGPLQSARTIEQKDESQ